MSTEMSDGGFCPSHDAVFRELAERASGIPLLALGQTPFWDEPMKAGVALCARHQGFESRFVAGVHDTDYFAKHPGTGTGGYALVPHNDTSTRDLWSAAGEFSALFGSETVITREKLTKSGANLARVARERPGLLDEVTAAWGWRGVAFGGEETPVIAETHFAPIQDALLQGLDWAIETTLDALPPCERQEAAGRAAELRTLACGATESAEQGTLSDYYQALLPQMYAFACGKEVPMEVTSTTRLLRLNRSTAARPRFRLVDLFLRPETAAAAREAYNQALQGTEIYTLDRFGSWAIPFDLVIPGKGRGTLRVAPKAIVIMTPVPQFISLKRPVTSIADLAEAVERKFGPECTLVGKAVSLLGMLGAEHVFVFHQGASAYVPYTQAFHRNLGELCPPLHPILRVKYPTWDALQECNRWLRLPDPLRGPFGSDEVSAASFSTRWREAVRRQGEVLQELQGLRRPVEMVRWLAERYSASWGELSRHYDLLRQELLSLNAQLEEVRVKKRAALDRLRGARAARQAAERAKGDHWRAVIFEKEPHPRAWADRKLLGEAVVAAARAVAEARAAWQALDGEQRALVSGPEVRRAHLLRRDLELEVELFRLRLVRDAVTVASGLVRAGYRPSAWWFPLLCPDGGWFRETTSKAEYYLENLA